MHLTDLESLQGSITMPGTLTATSLSHIIDVEEGFGSSATTAGSMGSSTMPLVYYYGYPQPSENVKLYKILMSRMAIAMNGRCAGDEEGELRSFTYCVCSVFVGSCREF